MLGFMARQDAAALSNTKPIPLVLILAVLFPSDSISASSPIASGGASKVLVARRFVRQVFDAPTLTLPPHHNRRQTHARHLYPAPCPGTATTARLSVLVASPMAALRRHRSTRLPSKRTRCSQVSDRKAKRSRCRASGATCRQYPSTGTPFPQHTLALALALACDKMSLL